MTQRGVLTLAFGIAAAVLVGLFLLVALEPSVTERQRTVASATPGVTAIRPAEVKQGVLSNRGSEVPLALTEAAFDELNKAASRRDLEGFKAVFFRGDALMIAEGTRAQDIGGWFTGRKVKILYGPFKGKSGWVTAEQFK